MWPFMPAPSASTELMPYDPTVQDERPAPADERIEFTARCDLCGQDAIWKAGLVVIKDVIGHGNTSVASSSTDHDCAAAA